MSDKSDKLTCCQDCLEVYRRPCLMPCCLNAICEQSARDMFAAGSPPKCPFCNANPGVTDVSELPPMGLVEVVPEDMSIIQGCILCDESGTEHCKICDLHFCKVHADTHLQAKRYAAHCMEPTVPRMKTIYECRLHEGHLLTGFCMTCLKPTCDICCMEEHDEQHTMASLAEAYDDLIAVRNRPDAIEYFDEFEKKVKDEFARIIAEMQKRCDELIEKGREKILTKGMTMEKMRERMANFHRWCDMAKENASDPLILLHIYRYLAHDMPDAVDAPSFRMSSTIDTNNIGYLVAHRNTQRLKSVFDWRGSLVEETHITFDGDFSPHGVAFVRDDIVVVSDIANDRLMLVATATGRCVRVIGERRMQNENGFSPCGVCVDAHRNILVAYNKNNTVKCYNEDGQFLMSFRTLIQPIGITIMDGGRVAVSHNNRQFFGGQCCITIYTRQGTHLLNIETTCRSYFSDIKYHQHELYVTATDLDKVLVFSAVDGKFIREFGMGVMKACNGLAITDEGFVLVTEKNPGYCMSLWSPSGERVGVWGNKSVLPSPYHLTIMPNGKIAVITSGDNPSVDVGQMKIFSIK